MNFEFIYQLWNEVLIWEIKYKTKTNKYKIICDDERPSKSKQYYAK